MSEVEPEVPAEAPAEPAPSGMGVAVFQGLPDVEMVVQPGNTVSPSGEDVSYSEGEVFTVDGPTAIALAAGGHAIPTGAPPSDNGAAAEDPAPIPEGEVPVE